jgi:DedD protein
MAFFKFRNGGTQGNSRRNASASAVPTESVEAMRRRARHRLLGAAVLVLLGVIGFPLLFDTQPRPVAVDIPIEIPDRAKSRPLAVPVAPNPAPIAMAPEPTPAPRVASAAQSSSMITESADGTEIPSTKSSTAPATTATLIEKPEPMAEPKLASKPDLKPKAESKPEPKPEPKAKPEPKVAAAKPADDGARASALLNGKTPDAAAKQPAAAEGGRFVVQVGAFADASKAREVRQKLERAGLKTYAQVTKSAEGERTRVRIGPFANRADADRAASRVKGLSLSAAVLTL